MINILTTAVIFVLVGILSRFVKSNPDKKYSTYIKIGWSAIVVGLIFLLLMLTTPSTPPDLQTFIILPAMPIIFGILIIFGSHFKWDKKDKSRKLW